MWKSKLIIPNISSTCEVDDLNARLQSKLHGAFKKLKYATII